MSTNNAAFHHVRQIKSWCQLSKCEHRHDAASDRRRHQLDITSAFMTRQVHNSFQSHTVRVAGKCRALSSSSAHGGVDERLVRDGHLHKKMFQAENESVCENEQSLSYGGREDWEEGGLRAAVLLSGGVDSSVAMHRLVVSKDDLSLLN